jgi:hypothetical protein
VRHATHTFVDVCHAYALCARTSSSAALEKFVPAFAAAIAPAVIFFARSE